MSCVCGGRSETRKVVTVTATDDSEVDPGENLNHGDGARGGLWPYRTRTARAPRERGAERIHRGRPPTQSISQ